MKTAIPLKHDPDAVLLDDGRTVSRLKAEREGYEIDAASGRTGEQREAFTSWRLAIECLPEARDRQAATAELIASRNPDSLTVDQARAFLRGLPVETTTEQTDNAMTDTDPRAARRAEIAHSMNAFNKNRGYQGKAIAPSLGDVSPEVLRRKAEIEASMRTFNRQRGYKMQAVSQPALKQLAENRIAELVARGQGRSEEAKLLRTAVDTHNATGAPLERTLSQLGVGSFLTKS